LNKVISQGIIAICEEGRWISQAKGINAIIEASNSITPAAECAITALQHHKHVILMNSEIDLIYGPLLSSIATDNGVVCTSCDGDQYGVMKHLIEDIVRWGFELVMVGNIKGFLDRYSNPKSIIPEADKRNLDYRMCTSYTDGTKLNIEMAIIANAYGLATLVPGMYGPPMDHVGKVLYSYDFDRLWKDRTPFVDYILGAEPGGGVFAVGHCENPYQQSMLSYYKMGNGPYYLFYRPYHLCHIEAMETIFNAVLHNDCLLSPLCGFQTNVYTYAKEDLPVGQSLDGIGGYTCYGKIENCTENETCPGVPICLAEKVTLKRAVKKDERIGLEDVVLDSERADWQLYKKAMAQSRKVIEHKNTK
jgi:predicted homoserine dehydrogenase-like protein